jgi:hypothetical protein
MIDAIRLVSVLISTEDSATSFDNFKNSTGKEQFAVAASKQSGEGVYCFPIDVSQLGLGDEVKEGSKATLQIAFDGGDGSLYQVKDRVHPLVSMLTLLQCADVVFSSSVKSPSNDELKCKSTLTVPSPSPIGTATATSAGAGSTAGGSSTAAGGSGGSSSTSPASKSSPAPSSSSSAPAPSGGAAGVQIPALTGLLGLFGLAFAAL